MHGGRSAPLTSGLFKGQLLSNMSYRTRKLHHSSNHLTLDNYNVIYELCQTEARSLDKTSSTSQLAASPFSEVEQGLPTRALLPWRKDSSLLCAEGCSVVALGSTHGMPTPTKNEPTPNLSRHCQMSPGGQNHPQWKPLGLRLLLEGSIPPHTAIRKGSSNGFQWRTG